MARSKVYFDTSFWDNAAIQEDFTATDKLFFIYLITNSQAQGKSKYRISRSRMAFDLSISLDGLDKLIEVFQEDFQIINYKEDEQLMTFDDSLYFLFRK